MGSNYLNYQWNLISDLCFFSYEVNPNNGNAYTTHGWMAAPVIDSAQANGVRTHLCVTLFSGHALFFGNPDAKQTLINSLIELISSRGADGVNLDFEAVPASQGEAMVNFVIDFSQQFHAALPGAMVSMAIPAVDWSGIFDIEALNGALDLFMIMGYDYYWNGSQQAGPVSPLYAMTGGYSYSQARTVSYYEKEGIPKDKMLLGVPYYARQWPVEGQFAPQNTMGYGQALTYEQVVNNSSGNYGPEHKYWEPNSFSTYYSFDNGSGYHHCFLCAPSDLSKRYDQVNYRGYAGIGIWALGYDDGRNELWDLIAEKFSSCAVPAEMDTIFDTGGPAWGHYNNEDYTMTVGSPDGMGISLEFISLDLEPGYDSLWIYDGPGLSSPLIGGYSGYLSPFTIQSSGPHLTLHFQSDGATTQEGWHAAWMAAPLMTDQIWGVEEVRSLRIYPNPVRDVVSCEVLVGGSTERLWIEVWSMSGQLMERVEVDSRRMDLPVSHYSGGSYRILLRNTDLIINSQRIIIH
jgi:hypothetical protein